MDILNPPKSYINWRCTTHDWESARDSTPEKFNKIRDAFFKQFPDAEEEIRQFSKWLENARNERTLPYEKIEIRESNGKKHGHIVRIMIYDIQYWREGKQVRNKKIYMVNQGDLAVEEAKKIDLKMRSAGDYQEEVPF